MDGAIQIRKTRARAAGKGGSVPATYWKTTAKNRESIKTILNSPYEVTRSDNTLEKAADDSAAAGDRSKISRLIRPGSSDKMPVTSRLAQAIDAERGNGRAIKNGQDDAVNLHQGPGADQLTETLKSKAFTVGNDIFLNSNHYREGTKTGGHLLAHELAHVTQAKQLGEPNLIQRNALPDECVDDMKSWECTKTLYKYGVSNEYEVAEMKKKGEIDPPVSAEEKQKKKMAELDGQITALSKDNKQQLYNAISIGSDLVDSWHSGVTQAVAGFSPTCMTDNESFVASLSGNMLWAASSLTKISWLVIPMSFIGAYQGTAGADGSFGRISRELKGDYKTGLNNIRDKLQHNMDKALYGPMSQFGYSAFDDLSLQEKRKKVWGWLFKMTWPGEKVTNASADYVTTIFDDCDKKTKSYVKKLHGYWTKSFTGYGQFQFAPYWKFSRRKWYSLTDFPIRDYCGKGGAAINFSHIRNKNIPAFVSEEFANTRAQKIFRMYLRKTKPGN